MEAADINTLRILVATDSHLGYLEKDEIRRHDSFNSFDEICSIASQRQVDFEVHGTYSKQDILGMFMLQSENKVDFLLLGGDLFHENKPSRSTLVRTIEILRRYCLNDQPVKFQVVSDQTINFPNKFGLVNYEDPHFNVGLPIFTIHGNHDDPAGVDNLSAIDILAACNLVNYFGKVVLGGTGVGQIALHPILLRKGSTNVALYGLGNIRDERLNRMFQTPHAVQWIRPESSEECPTSDWFNIFVLHQNRVKANPKNAINEHMLAKFLDFVVWGHEHECLVDPQEVLGMDFHVSQPGSSVATSLLDGESKSKHVLLLEIKGHQYRPTKIPLQSVRPFKHMDVSLQDAPDLDPNDQTAVLEYLGKVVQDLLSEAAEKEVGRPEPMLPLIRVRVDYTGFTTINPQRFGQKFVGKVANPHDILLFTKVTKRRAAADGKIDEEEKLRPEELNQQNIEALVAESNLKMEILPVTDLGMALHDFVSKDDKQAFYSCVQLNLDDTQNKLAQEADLKKIEEDDLVVKVSEHMQKREKESVPRFREAASSSPANDHHSTLEQRTSQAHLSGARATDKDEGLSDDEVRGQNAADTSTKRKLPASKATRDKSESSRGRGRGWGRGSRGLTQTTLNVVQTARPPKRAAAAASLRKSISDDEGSESDKDSDEEPEQPAKRTRRAAPTTSQRGKRGAATKQGGGSSAHGSRSTFIDDDDVEEDDEKAAPTKASATPSSQRRSSWGSLRS